MLETLPITQTLEKEEQCMIVEKYIGLWQKGGREENKTKEAEFWENHILLF